MNTRVHSHYIAHLEGQMSIHRLPEQLETCGQSITGFPTNKVDKVSIQQLDTKMEEMNAMGQ